MIDVAQPASLSLAAEVGCGFFDTLAFMGGPGSMVRWVTSSPPLALSDHVHLTDDGHRAGRRSSSARSSRERGRAPVRYAA